jgi:hypothetical protein
MGVVVPFPTSQRRHAAPPFDALRWQMLLLSAPLAILAAQMRAHAEICLQVARTLEQRVQQ